LLDMGVACNDAALALKAAYVEHVRSINSAAWAEACGDRARHRGHFAGFWLECTVSYTDQLTAAYTTIASTFVAYATAVATALAAGAHLPTAHPDPIRPSRILCEPDIYLPLVQMPAKTNDDNHPLARHNDELAAHHRTLIGLVDSTVRSHPVDLYDDPSRLATRAVRSAELQRNLANSLHAYAAMCTWAVGLATRVPPV
jgi:hypothetical protein